MNKLSALALSFAALVSLASSGCAADTDLEEDIGDTEEAVRRGTSGVAGDELEAEEIALLLRNAGIPAAVIPKMVCTAFYESRWHDRSWNARNSNGTIDRGLFQINSVHLKRGELCSDMKADDLWNPAKNVKCAKKIYDAQGLNAWYGYRAHRTTKTSGGIRQLGCDAYKIGADIETRPR